MEFSIREGFDPEVYMESANVFGELLDNYYPEAFEDSYDFSNMFESEGSTPAKPSGAVKTGFIASVKNAYHAMIEKLKAVIKKCRDFIALKFASAETKAKVKELQETIDANPDLKGIKVTVPDYEKINSLYGSANKKAADAYYAAEKKDTDPNELQKQLNAIEETTKKAIPTAVKAIGITLAAAAATGLLKNIDSVMKAADDKAKELAKNVEKAVADFGHPNSEDNAEAASKKTRSTRRRMLFDGHISKMAGHSTKESTYSLKTFWGNVFKALGGNKLAKAELKDHALNSDGKVAKAARIAYGVKIRYDGAKEEEERIADKVNARRAKEKAKADAKAQREGESRMGIGGLGKYFPKLRK